jgi:hypothetical protein
MLSMSYFAYMMVCECWVVHVVLCMLCWAVHAGLACSVVRAGLCMLSCACYTMLSGLYMLKSACWSENAGSGNPYVGGRVYTADLLI